MDHSRSYAGGPAVIMVRELVIIAAAIDAISRKCSRRALLRARNF